MPLGTEVDLGPGRIVPDGDPAVPTERDSSFVRVFSGIFLLPVSVYALVELFYRLVCNLLCEISHLSTVAVAVDVKRRLLTLFPVLPKLEVVFNSQTVADRTTYCTKVE